MTRKRIVNAITVCVLVSAISRPVSTFASAGVAQQESGGAEFAYGFASPLLTVVHLPVKVALCGGTAVLSGIMYLVTFGNTPVMQGVSDAVKAACTGPYIITPQQLRTDSERSTSS